MPKFADYSDGWDPLPQRINLTAETIKLNAAQRVLLTSFAQGEFQYMLDLPDEAALNDAVSRSGNGLLKYLLTELSEHEDCIDLETASRRLQNSIRQLFSLDLGIAAAAESSHHLKTEDRFPWETIVEYFGLDPSFQYNEEKKAMYRAAYNESVKAQLQTRSSIRPSSLA